MYVYIYIYIHFFWRSQFDDGGHDEKRDWGTKGLLSFGLGLEGDLFICVPQSKLSVSGRIGIPMSQGCHPSFQPGPLSYKVGE